MLTEFQLRAIAVIRQVNGEESAEALRQTYIDHNSGDEGETFALGDIVPLPAKCGKCKRNWVDKDAIRAPSLEGCRCFYCGGVLVAHPKFPAVQSALDRRRQLERDANSQARQLTMF